MSISRADEIWKLVDREISGGDFPKTCHVRELEAMDRGRVPLTKATVRPPSLRRDVSEKMQIQNIAMFCARDKHVMIWSYLGIETVGEAIEYVEHHGVPGGMTKRTWEDILTKAKMYREF